MHSYSREGEIDQVADHHAKSHGLEFTPLCADRLLSNSSTESENEGRNHQQQSVGVHDGAQVKPKVGTYVIERTLGRGIFSIVKLATHTITGLNVAIKIIDKTRLDSDNKVKVYRESEILKKLHFPNIVKLFQVMETTRFLFVVMEYLPNGELFEYIAKHGRFSETEARMKFIDILTAVDYAHCNGIVHRDIKAENVLFDANMNLKLIDFSFGTRHHTSGSTALLSTWCGSPPYAAPEIFKGEPYSGTKADIWSLGVVLYVMVCGSLPFDAQPLPLLKHQVLSACFRVPYWLSTVCEQLLRWMLSKLPSKRPTTRDVFQHSWLTGPLPGVNTAWQIPKPFFQSTNSAQNSSTDLVPVPCINRIGLTEDLFNTSSFNHSVRQSDVTSPFNSHITSSNLAADIEMGRINHLVLLIMESYGMQRTQILESLGRCAYDHLMATYLLLGEKLHQHRNSLPQIVFPVLHNAAVETENLFTNPIPSSDTNNSYLYPKPSRADSAVDMKTSTSESEYLLDSSTPSLNLLEYEPVSCPSSELINLPCSHVDDREKKEGRKYHNFDGAPFRFLQSWSKHISDVPQLPESPSTVDRMVNTFHPFKLQPPVVSESLCSNPSVFTSAATLGKSPPPLSRVSAMPTEGLSPNLDEPDNPSKPFERFARDAQLTYAASLQWSSSTSSESAGSNIVQRCSLVRRKYGVATPPICMAQLIGLFDSGSTVPVTSEKMDEVENDRDT